MPRPQFFCCVRLAKLFHQRIPLIRAHLRSLSIRRVLLNPIQNTDGDLIDHLRLQKPRNPGFRLSLISKAVIPGQGRERIGDNQILYLLHALRRSFLDLQGSFRALCRSFRALRCRAIRGCSRQDSCCDQYGSKRMHHFSLLRRNHDSL